LSVFGDIVSVPELISPGELAMRTVVDIDETSLREARAALGTSTKVETVNRALAEVAALAARRRDLQRLRANELPTLGDASAYDAAWR
jgi:Arc/MetJ family transcription regulator